MYRISLRNRTVVTALSFRVVTGALLAVALLAAQVQAAPDDDLALLVTGDQMAAADDAGTGHHTHGVSVPLWLSHCVVTAAGLAPAIPRLAEAQLTPMSSRHTTSLPLRR